MVDEESAKYDAEVVEKKLFWVFHQSVEVVLKKLFCVIQWSVEVVEKKKPLLNAASKATAPFAYESPFENVVVAVHVGTPFNSARMLPAVPEVVVASGLAPLP